MRIGTARMMHASERPYFFYGRVSSEDQAEDGTIESQQYDLHLWQAERDVWNAGEFWDDPASGTLLLEDRPAALELIEAMRPFKDLNPVLVITRMSRITRGDVWVYACAMRTLQTLNCSLISLAEQFEVVSTGFTEAEIAASIFHRFAYEGASTIAEARRLNAMRVPTARRYGNGKLVEVGSTWLASRVRQMLMNPVYKGVHVFKSKLGTIEREVPALVTSEEWMLANRNLQRNRALSKRNAKRTYLLRGLIRCGDCGAGYAHTFNHSNRPADRPEGYYRCNSQIGAMNPEARTRCQGKMLKAVTLEDYVWSKIKDFAADPQRTLALAQSELRQRLGNVADRAKRESELRRILAGKAEERKRSREASRRGTITLDELKEDLDAIAEETNTLRAELEQLRNERDLAEDQERNLTSAATMLRQVAENAEDISRSNDVDRKRAIAERLVSKIVVTTEIIGQERNNGRLRKQARVDVYFYFGERTAAAIGTTGSASDNNALMLLARLVVGGAAVAA
jgi:hypothetical protein